MLSKRMVGITEAAKLLGVGVSTLREWDRSGAFKAARTIGQQRRYRIEDIEKMQEARGKAGDDSWKDGRT